MILNYILHIKSSHSNFEVIVVIIVDISSLFILQASGAYIFRPNSSNVYSVNAKIINVYQVCMHLFLSLIITHLSTFTCVSIVIILNKTVYRKQNTIVQCKFVYVNVHILHKYLKYYTASCVY